MVKPVIRLSTSFLPTNFPRSALAKGIAVDLEPPAPSFAGEVASTLSLSRLVISRRSALAHTIIAPFKLTAQSLVGDQTIMVKYGQATPPTGQFTQVTAGSLHACAITIDNTTRCWGVIIDDRSGPPLVIYRGGTGTGTVTMSPPGIDCMPLPPLESIIGADTLNWGPNTCYQTYPPFPNTVTVTLTATPDADSAFDGWSDLIGCPGTGSCQITMNPTPPFNNMEKFPRLLLPSL